MTDSYRTLMAAGLASGCLLAASASDGAKVIVLLATVVGAWAVGPLCRHLAAKKRRKAEAAEVAAKVRHMADYRPQRWGGDAA